MGTYAVTVTRCETATIKVEADDAPAAEAAATALLDDDWEADTINSQVDDVREVVAS